jgi:hypothetical protein
MKPSPKKDEQEVKLKFAFIGVLLISSAQIAEKKDIQEEQGNAEQPQPNWPVTLSTLRNNFNNLHKPKVYLNSVTHYLLKNSHADVMLDFVRSKMPPLSPSSATRRTSQNIYDITKFHKRKVFI